MAGRKKGKKHAENSAKHRAAMDGTVQEAFNDPMGFDDSPDPFAWPPPDLDPNHREFDFTIGLPPEANPFENAARDFDPKPDYTGDPVLWGRDKLGEHYWSMQAEILASVRDNRYTAVPSCHGAGKSYIAARAIAKWIDDHEPGEAFVVSTAPTAAQVGAILWRELQKAHGKGGLIGQITSSGYPQWKINNGELVGYGRKPADYSDSAFQGIHARYVLVVLDEAGGIPENLYNAVDALATNKHARVLAIGNPDDPTTHFARICKPNSGWNVVRIDGLKTPNFTRDAVEWLDCEQCRNNGRTENMLTQLFREENLKYSEEYVPEDLRDMLISPLWVEERLHRWVGEPVGAQTLAEAASKTSLFTAKVRGQFPTSSTEGVIPLGWIEAAIQRYHDWIETGGELPNGRLVIGADIAASGADQSVLARRRGNVVYQIDSYRESDTMTTTGHITAGLTEPQAVAVVDSIGIGAGVIDRLRELGKPVHPFTASGSAQQIRDKSGEYLFKNIRAAAWWNMRELLDPSARSIIALPDLEMLKADLATPKWKVTSGGRIQIESKEEIKKRLGRSTDSGDAVVQSFWIDSAMSDSDSDETGVVSWWDERAAVASQQDGSVISWGINDMSRSH